MTTNTFQAGTSEASAAVVLVQPSGKLGPFGDFLEQYRVGDFAGILGLVISVIGFWIAIRTAKEAKAAAIAAEVAAKRALKARDRIEIASLVSELSQRLKDLRDASQLDDWAVLGMKFDNTTSLAIRIEGSVHELTDEEGEVIVRVKSVLGRLHLQANGIKDASKRKVLKNQFFQDIQELVHAIESGQAKRLKNGL